jgi:hypothetical protein
VTNEPSGIGRWFWDGSKWVSAVSTDGRWRWDGTAWRPLVAQRTGRRNTIVVAAAIGLLVLMCVGGLAAAVAVQRRNATISWKPDTSRTCHAAGASAGAPVAEGDDACVRSLGRSRYGVDCTKLASGTPQGLDAADAQAGSSTWTPVTLRADVRGCAVAVVPDHQTDVRVSSGEWVEGVVIADFVPTDSSGAIGIQVACSTDSCTEFTVWGNGDYSLAQRRSNGDFNILVYATMGQEGYRTSLLRIGAANRVILKLKAGHVQVFMNGREVASASPRQPPGSGPALFYVDDRDSKAAATVELQRLFVFEPR